MPAFNIPTQAKIGLEWASRLIGGDSISAHIDPFGPNESIALFDLDAFDVVSTRTVWHGKLLLDRWVQILVVRMDGQRSFSRRLCMTGPPSRCALSVLLVRCKSRVRGILWIVATILLLLAGSAHVASAQSGHSKQAISVQFLDFRSGRPLTKLNVTITFWNGNSGLHGRIDPKNVVSESSMKTDKDGKVTVPVPEPMPDRLSIFQPDLADAFSPDFSPAEVLVSGSVTAYQHMKDVSNLQVSAKQGEIVILNKRLNAWDRMRQEVP